MSELKKNFISGFLQKELPAFTPIILFKMQDKGKEWIESFECILNEILINLKQLELLKQTNENENEDKKKALNLKLDRLEQDFLKYEQIFYKTVIDKGFMVAFNENDDSELKNVCIKTLQKIVKNALCIGKDNTWTKSEKLNSKQLRYYPDAEDTLDLEDCLGAVNDIWDYIQASATVDRNENNIKMKRLLTFKRTGQHYLLISYMTESKSTFTCWLQRVIIKIGNSISKYRENVSSKTDSIDEAQDASSEDGVNPDAKNKEIADAREKAERPFYTKMDVAAHWAYYTAQRIIMSEACPKQYETWLLRMGFPQMFTGQNDSALYEEEQNDSLEEKEHGICIDDTSLILACLTHDEQWKAKQCEIDVDGTLVLGNPDVWTHRLAKKRPSFISHQNNALVNISKLNSLFLNRLDGEQPGWTSESRNYFARLLHSKDTINENSTAQLAVKFRDFFKDDDKRNLPFLDILAGNIPKDQETEVDDFLEKYELKSVTDLLEVYFKNSSENSAIGTDCLLCRDVTDLAIKKITKVISKETIEDTQKFDDEITQLFSNSTILSIEIMEDNPNVYNIVKKKLEKVINSLPKPPGKNVDTVQPIIFQKTQISNIKNEIEDVTIIVSIRRKIFINDTIKKLLL